jgi:SagB-type dehydrogenase family enzyme
MTLAAQGTAEHAPAPFEKEEALAFAARLRGEFAEIYPSAWSIDWDRIPCIFKRYPDLPVSWLPEAHPPFLHAPASSAAGTLAGLDEEHQLGTILQCAYGVTSLRWYPEGIAKSSPTEPQSIHRDAHYQIRRPTPSGGVTFPGEIYLCYRGDGLRGPGLYHYDGGRHALVLLTSADPAQFGADSAAADLLREYRWVLIVTVAFWKNYFKYADFSYRLSALDMGAVLGQLFRVAECIGQPVRARWQFSDRLVSQALGLTGQREGPYTLVGIGDPVAPVRPVPAAACAGTMEYTGDEKPPPPDSGAIRMQEACLREPPVFGKLTPSGFPRAGERVPLPKPPALPPQTCAQAFGRTALGEQFRASPLTASALSAMLAEVCRGVASDLFAVPSDPLAYPVLGVVVRNVPGVPAGAYFYDPAAGELVRAAAGDFGPALQASMFASYMNIGQVPACLHVMGSSDFQIGTWGVRGLRIEHTLAGVMTQRLLVAVHALGLSGHPVLGITTRVIEAVYQLQGTGLTPLITLPVGAARRALYLETTTVG